MAQCVTHHLSAGQKEFNHTIDTGHRLNTHCCTASIPGGRRDIKAYTSLYQLARWERNCGTGHIRHSTNSYIHAWVIINLKIPDAGATDATNVALT
jgi:hypothetical protein